MNSSKETRNVVFDVMKGIGIICMLLGHTDELSGSSVQQFIYTFHMPLFFILAGYFTKVGVGNKWTMCCAKYARRLLIPYLFTFFLLFLWGTLQACLKDEIQWMIRPLLSVVYGSCDVISSEKYGAICVGAFWFVLGLFWAKCLFTFILTRTQNKWLVLTVSAVISIASVLLYRFTRFGFWSILPGLSSIIFLAIGWWARTFSIPVYLKCLAVICWPLCYFFSDIDMSVCSYGFYPLDIIGACGGTYIVYLISLLLVRCRPMAWCLQWCGRKSLVILSFHVFELLSAIAWSIMIHTTFVPSQYTTLYRYGLTLLMVIVVTKLPVLRKIYR